MFCLYRDSVPSTWWWYKSIRLIADNKSKTIYSLFFSECFCCSLMPAEVGWVNKVNLPKFRLAWRRKSKDSSAQTASMVSWVISSPWTEPCRISATERKSSRREWIMIPSNKNIYSIDCIVQLFVLWIYSLLYGLQIADERYCIQRIKRSQIIWYNNLYIIKSAVFLRPSNRPSVRHTLE